MFYKFLDSFESESAEVQKILSDSVSEVANKPIEAALQYILDILCKQGNKNENQCYRIQGDPNIISELVQFIRDEYAMKVKSSSSARKNVPRQQKFSSKKWTPP